ncbi:hypothetical protein WJX84_003707 [Apatococcus fuscideae]|uniref:Uncharacterized protein n=1 Tax=Apatococcus fuscideae TaxID=2026836 RepID=A0AAW1TFR0_9CHLO
MSSSAMSSRPSAKSEPADLSDEPREATSVENAAESDRSSEYEGYESEWDPEGEDDWYAPNNDYLWSSQLDLAMPHLVAAAAKGDLFKTLPARGSHECRSVFALSTFQAVSAAVEGKLEPLLIRWRDHTRPAARQFLRGLPCSWEGFSCAQQACKSESWRDLSDPSKLRNQATIGYNFGSAALCTLAVFKGDLGMLRQLRHSPKPCPMDGQTCQLLFHRGNIALLEELLEAEQDAAARHKRTHNLAASGHVQQGSWQLQAASEITTLL